MRYARFAAACVVAVMLMPLSAAHPGSPGPSVRARADTTQAGFDAVVNDLTSLLYQPAYVPVGTDSAFPGQMVLNTAPAEDYTSGSIPGSPDAPSFPSSFNKVEIHSADGAPFYAEVALHAGQHPGIVVVHGFNTNGKESVVRWAAMLAANGYNVIAADQRDFAEEYQAGKGYPTWRQTYGWKEAQDIIAAGQYLAAQPGVTSVGVVGFSEGAQDTVLAMARSHVFAAGITFSGPADQDTQQYSTAVPQNCSSPNCSYPATDALVAAVVPPYTYTNTCDVLADAAKLYGVDGFDILARQSSFHAQTSIDAPLLNFYAADDPLVPAFQARMMAGYEQGAPLQRTLEILHGAHAYYYDRWWQQEAILNYFKDLLPGAASDATITVGATVNQTPGGTPLQSQLVALGAPTRAQADAYLAPYICDTSRGAPGAPPANGGGSPTVTSTSTSASTPTSTSTSASTPTSASMPTGTPTSTSTSTATPVPPTNMATNTPTNTPTNTGTNTPMPTSTPMPPTNTGTSIPATAPATTATATAVPPLTPAPTGTAAARPMASSCRVAELLLYASPIPRHRGHTKGRTVVVVFGLTGPDRSRRQPSSRTSLFFDDGHGMIFFTRKVYTALACGAPNRRHTATLLDVTGTIMDGQTARRQGRKLNLYNYGVRLRVLQGTPQRGQARYSLRVDIARLTYHETFTGLRGPGVIRD